MNVILAKLQLIKKIVAVFTFFMLPLSLAVCAGKHAAQTAAGTNISIKTFEKIQEKITYFLVDNFKVGSHQTDGVLTGKIDNLFSRVIYVWNTGSSKDKKKALIELSELWREYEIYWEDGASDSIDLRTMLISEVFLDLISSMLKPNERAAIMKKVNEDVDKYFPPWYDLGFLDYKIEIDLFNILISPYDSDEINNKLNKLFEYTNITVTDDFGFFNYIIDGEYYSIDPEILEFINSLKYME